MSVKKDSKLVIAMGQHVKTKVHMGYCNAKLYLSSSVIKERVLMIKIWKLLLLLKKTTV